MCDYPQRHVRLIRHEESFEVRVSRYFYFDDNPGRRSINQRMRPEEAERAAKAAARQARDRPIDDP